MLFYLFFFFYQLLAPNKEINIIVQELEQNAQLAVAAAAATQHTQDVLPSDSQSAELEASVRRKIENIKNEQKKTRVSIILCIEHYSKLIIKYLKKFFLIYCSLF